ncbi:MAG: hypothetical protein IPF99_42305 [Deltaproteobacteria bacterium]|nr:hypothetical protein [Deltaproteobacteria bacterium]
MTLHEGNTIDRRFLRYDRTMSDVDAPNGAVPEEPSILVRRIHRRDLNKVWEFLKLCFRVVNRETLEYQRPESKKPLPGGLRGGGGRAAPLQGGQRGQHGDRGLRRARSEITTARTVDEQSFFTRRRHATRC